MEITGLAKNLLRDGERLSRRGERRPVPDEGVMKCNGVVMKWLLIMFTPLLSLLLDCSRNRAWRGDTVACLLVNTQGTVPRHKALQMHRVHIPERNPPHCCGEFLIQGECFLWSLSQAHCMCWQGLINTYKLLQRVWLSEPLQISACVQVAWVQAMLASAHGVSVPDWPGRERTALLNNKRHETSVWRDALAVQ